MILLPSASYALPSVFCFVEVLIIIGETAILKTLNKYSSIIIRISLIMDSSEIGDLLYDSEPDDFLNIPINHQNFTIPQTQPHTQPHQKKEETSKNEKHKTLKQKGIAKQSKSSQKQKPPKRRKDQSANTQMGRPSNQDFQRDHLAINRSFNDIVYHFSRMMIFLKLKQDSQTSTHALELQNYQSAWMSETEHIMNLQNFPTYEEEKPAFLLHPNSLHYVFDYRRQKQKDIQYTEQEVKYMLIAFLKKRKMLTSTIYHYVNNYWPDIINLVNNPEGKQEAENFQIDQNDSAEVLDMPSSGSQNQGNLNTSHKNQRSKENESGRVIKKKEVSQMETLKKELAEDDSIGAYQIACYLHACCLKFQLKIVQNN